MYQDFFGIAENPFSITPDPRYLYMSSGHEEALAHLLYGVSEGGGFVLLTGEVGTGKTSICRCLLEQLPEAASVALILNPRLDEIELLASICDELDVTYPEGTRSLKVLVDRLNSHLLELHAAGRHAVVIIDEAQDLSPQVLEQVRLLTNLETATRKLLQVILIGQPELNALLRRDELRQVVQRITARYHLQPLGRADTQAYIQHRLAIGGLPPDLFSRRAIAAVYRQARGVPRLINSLCDRCLLGAYAQNRKAVDARLVRRATREVFGAPVEQRRGAPAALAWVAATAVLAGALLVLDPADLGLLPQAEGWRKAMKALVQGAPEAASQAAAERAALGRPETQPIEGAVGGEPARVEADGSAPADAATALPTAAEPRPETASEPLADAAPAVPEDSDAKPASGAAATINPDLDADPPASATAAPIEAVAVSTLETEEIALAPLLSAPLPSPSAAESLAAVAVEAQQAPPARTAGEPVAAEPVAAEPAAPEPVAAEPLAPAAEPTPVERAAAKGSAFQAAAPAPQPPLTLEDLFVRPALASDGDSALAALFGLWGLDDQGLNGPVDCASSARLGVKCLAEKTGWETLIGFNRPVLITLEDRRGRRARVVLADVQDDRATLLVGGQRIAADLAAVRAHWSGDYLMLWRPPPVYSGLLALGARGREVAWLKGRLAEVDGEPWTEVRDAVFDAGVHEKVTAFQRSRGLKPDGMVGVRTLIHLNTAAKVAGVPLLRPPAP